VEVKLREHETLEKPFGWVFFFNSTAFIKSGDIRDAVAGNAPFIIDSNDGSIHETGTALPIECYLENYEKYGTPFSTPR
jgi:hypothetical protein